MMLLDLNPVTIIINLIVLGVAMTAHEFAHNFVAWKMGDEVPRLQGRLTLNPLAHINWVGWLMFAIIGFGILGSAPISPERMRDPRKGFLAAVAAGPLSNLGLALVFAIMLRFSGLSAYGFLAYRGFEPMADPVSVIAALLYAMVFWNLLLFIFNLIPLFPVDGWHIVLSLLPGRWLSNMQVPVVIQRSLRPLSEFLMRPAFKWRDWQMASYYVFMALILLSVLPFGGFSPFGLFIGRPTSALLQLLLF
ncbi:MAG: site-2 protease family protein [Chloroflexota bacterium]|nr:site-2 protease family protein [Chloroflexota bacterium]MDE2909106.1 site-2 protease family protein [Chloroflexota bacterium]